MDRLASYCAAHKQSGDPCRARAVSGEKYCAYHKKVYSSKITHGLSASPAMLGIPKNKQSTFEAFMADDAPYDLRKEIAMLRLIAVEQREVLMKSSQLNLDEVENDYREVVREDLETEGVDEEYLEELTGIATKRFREMIESHYGSTIFLSPAQLSVISDTLDKIGKMAERAKKISEGITLNVNMKNSEKYFVQFARDIVFHYVPSPQDRARIVEDIRKMNLTGLGRPELPAAVEAEFTVVDDDEDEDWVIDV